MNTDCVEVLKRDIVTLMTVLGQANIFGENHIHSIIRLLRYKSKWKKFTQSELTSQIEKLHNDVWTHWKFEISQNAMIRVR